MMVELFAQDITWLGTRDDYSIAQAAIANFIQEIGRFLPLSLLQQWAFVCSEQEGDASFLFGKNLVSELSKKVIVRLHLSVWVILNDLSELEILIEFHDTNWFKCSVSRI